ncbi:MAG: riboflavin biosynthesis protein RibF [Oscillospiraceae bacterium]|jgi:riboflavin kinase/FMN adenylyltransferase|nr:riboflavin biosynthesis protein RibF [Oscillospiraceae bacterium]
MTTDKDATKASVALGMFDGLHLGHIEVIKAAMDIPGLIPSVFTFGGTGAKFPDSRAPGNIMTTQTKFALLKGMGIKTICAPEFESVNNLSAEEFADEILVDRMNAAHVSCGWNFRFSKNAAADANDLKRLCAARKIDVTVIPPIIIDGVPVNSTAIRALIKEGNVIAANKMLGRKLMYELPVTEGSKLARKLGAPTINQIIPDDCVTPKFGVYRSDVSVDVICYSAVTNIGVKPTIGGGVSKPIMETHIPGFNMEIYGQVVKTELLDFIRPEKKFDSVDELRKQIRIDITGACP